MVESDIITDNIVKQRRYGSAVASIPCTEVVFVSENKTDSDKSIPRENLQRTQTPHSYYLGDLWNAHMSAKKMGIVNMAASCSLMEKLGKKTYFSKGSEKNIKITTVEDIEIFKALLMAKRDEDKMTEFEKEDVKLVAEQKIAWDKLTNKTILISGGTGFIGSFIIEVLRYRNQYYNQGIKVISISRKGGMSDSMVEYLKADIVKQLQFDEPIDFILLGI